MNQRAAYWNQGVAQVPTMTGAASLMDGSDICAHATALGFTLPFASVLDVGCGTGRLAQFVTCYPESGRPKYIGCDIARDAVTYCRQLGLEAFEITGPSNLPQSLHPIELDGVQCWWLFPGEERRVFEWITCLSVFTHIPRSERKAYLREFTTRAPNLLVDIIPGDGSGDVAMWTADVPGFEADLDETGWRVMAQHDRPCPSGPTHRFYRCERGRD